jgi:hypothetical protein
VEIAVVSNGMFSYQARVYCYESICSTPGPTLIVDQGDYVRIELINNLENTSGRSNLQQFSKEIFYPNRTNLFFQSLPINPRINSPFRFTEGGGDSIFYTFRVPKTVSTGIHWYHSHVHGLSALHVMEGLVGAFIIENRNTTSYPTYFTTIPRKLLVLSHVFAQSTKSLYLENIPSTHSFSLQDEEFDSSSLSLSYLSNAYGSKVSLRTTYSTNNPTQISDVWLANNLYQPTYIANPGAWTIFDIIVASGDRIVELEIRSDLPGVVNSTRVCDLRLLARNGHYFDESRSGESVDHLVLLQGDRASLAVMCPTIGTFYMQSISATEEADKYFSIGDWTTKSIQLIAQIQTFGGFNDNSSAIEMLMKDLSFLKADIPSENLLEQYELSSFDSLPQLSFSTAQNSPLRVVDDGCKSLSKSSVTSLPYGRTAVRSSYQIGAGELCRNPCYDDILCTALFGTSNYSTDMFPVTLNAECTFSAIQVWNAGANIHDCPSTVNVTAVMEDIWDDQNRWTSDMITELLPGTLVMTATQRLYQLRVFGYASFPYPIYMQNHDMQLVSFENVNPAISNILHRDDYIGRYNYNISSFGFRARDRSNLMIPLEGQTTYIVEMLPDDDVSVQKVKGLYPILSTYLKFTDHGFLRFVHITMNESGNSEEPSLAPSPAPTISEPAPTSLRDISANYSQGAHVDSNSEPYLCDISGKSSLYEEEIDMATRTRIIRMNSCPNHYSICQNAQCGGDMKTRSLKWFREIRVPLYPVLAEHPQDVTCTADMVGIASNGVGIFSPADGGKQECLFFKNDTRSRFGRTPCIAGYKGEGLLTCGDSMQLNRRQLDKCGGYSDEFYHNQYFSGLYRYTSLPTCLLNQLTTNNSLTVPPQSLRKGHSVQLGWALDGFPIYGPTGIRGILMRRCGLEGAHPQICLDNCNGYSGRLPGVDEYIYRYYMTGNHTVTELNGNPGELRPSCSKHVRLSNNKDGSERCERLTSPCCRSVVPDVSFFPYTLGCFRGCLLSTDLLKENNERTQQTCFLTSKPATTNTFIPSIVFNGAQLYNDTESQSLYGNVVSSLRVASNLEENSEVATDGQSMVAPEMTSLLSSTSVLRDDRRVLYRNPFDLSLDLLSARAMTRDELSNEVQTVRVESLILGGSRDRSGLDLANSSLTTMNPIKNTIAFDEKEGTVNTLATVANTDHIFTGMVIDPRCNMMYFTDQQRIYKHVLDPETAKPIHPVPVVVVGGIIKVDLFGFNLGVMYEDILQITVQENHVCTSIVHVNAQHVSCLLTTSIAFVNDTVGASLHASDVMVRTVSGRTYGISLDAQVQVAAGVTRPIVTRVHFNRLPLVPYGLSLVIDPMHNNASIPSTLLVQTNGKSSIADISPDVIRQQCLSGEDVTLYWTNTAPSGVGQSIQRSLGNGRQLETVVTNIPKGRGLVSFPAILDIADVQFAYAGDQVWTVTNVTIHEHTDERETFPVVTPNYDVSCAGTGYEFVGVVHDQEPLFAQSDYSSTVEPAYDSRMQYLEATGVDPLVFLGRCRHRLGHVLFVADANLAGQLLRVQLLPIHKGAVFQPYLGYDASGLFPVEFPFTSSAANSSSNCTQLSTVLLQGLETHTIQWLLTTTLLKDVYQIQAVEIDHVANKLYLTTRDSGLILSTSTATLLQATNSLQFLDWVSASHYLQYFTQWFPDVVFNGQNTTQSKISWPVSLDIPTWQLHCTNGRQEVPHLSSWLQLIHCGPLLTRAHGLVVFPLSLDSANANAGPVVNGSIPVRIPWLRKQRMILIDTSQHQLVAVREQGIRAERSTDLGRSFQIVFPHQVRHFRTVASSEPNVWKDELLLSEYLGRIWKITVHSSQQNSTLYIGDDVLRPTLVLDWSAYTASIKVREIVTDHLVDGLRTHDSVFFEATP